MLPFACKDVASVPPTTVIIVDPNNIVRCDASDTVFAVSEEHVEPTDGWLHREGKPNMTICFMHSFGKCSGRTGGDPSTCYQVHIKRDVLATLRSQYVNAPRAFFTRIVHAQLTENLQNIISVSTRKEFRMQYLDYKVHNVLPTSGLQQYEAAYRSWLFYSDSKREGVMEENKVYQCDNYALRGTCPNEEECAGIHAQLNKAQVRDRAVAHALNKLTKASQSKEPIASYGGGGESFSATSLATSSLVSTQPQNASE